MTDKTTYNLYNGQVVIEFTRGAYDRYKLIKCFNYDADRLAATNKGMLSVTQACGIIDKSTPLVIWATRLAGDYMRNYLHEAQRDSFTWQELLPLIDEAIIQHKQVKQEAGSIGDMVHDYAQSFAQAQIDKVSYPVIPDTLPQQAVNGINAFIDAVKQEQLEFLECEKVVYDHNFNYIGRFDLLAKNKKGNTILVDYKTSKGVYSSFFPQLGGYVQAFGITVIQEAQIWHFDKEKGSFAIIRRSGAQILEDILAFNAALRLKRYDKQLTKELK